MYSRKTQNNCRKCNVEIQGPPNKRYCDKCRKLMNKEASQKQTKAKKENKNEI